MANEFVVKNGLVSPNVQLQGSTSGTVTIAAPAVAGTTSITLPSNSGTFVTTGDTGTVTNTMLAGSIANNKLANSALTVGTTSISLGGSSTTLAGLASVTSTSFVGALTGNASTASSWQTARTLSYTGDATGYLSVDGSTNVSTALTLAASGVTAGTYNNVTVNAKGLVTSGSNTSYLTAEADTLATVTARGNTTSTSIQVDYITTTNNGNGTNVRIGDDVWIGDVNTAYTMRVAGVSDNTKGYIIFGNGDSTALGRSGTGALTYGGNTVYHSGNLTNLNQLINGPGYITGYTETDTLASVTGRGFVARTSTGTFATATQGTPAMEVQGAGGTEPAYMTFHRPGAYALRLGLDGNDLKVGGWSMGANAYTIYHSGNLTNLNQLSNGPGYITGESDTLATVTGRGATTSTSIVIGGSTQQGGAALTVSGVTPIISVSQSSYGANYLTTLGARAGAQGFLILGNNGQNEIRGGRTTTGGYLDIFTNNTVDQASESDGVRAVRFDPSGNVLSYVSTRAPIFYDLNDTSYYGDFNSTSWMNTVKANVFCGRDSNGYGMYKGYDNNNHFITIRGSVSGTNTSPTISGAHHTTFVEHMNPADSSTGWFFKDSYSDGNYNYNTIARISASDSWVKNYLTGESSLRAPIFYDSNDTNYYLDPGYYSRLSYTSVSVGNESTGAGNSSEVGLVLRGNYNSNSWAHKFHKYDNGGGVPLYLSTTSGTSSWSAVQGWGAGLPYTSQVFGSLGATSGMYAPIFYDSDDTIYYLDPNSTSNIYNLTISGPGHKYLLISPGNGYEAMVRYNGGSGSTWYVGKRTTGQTVSTNDFHFYSEAAGKTVAGIDTGGNMVLTGSLSAISKSFVIDHPTKPGMKLRYGSLEGPENGVYVRGRLRGNKIELPEYWTKLVDPDSITVNLTAIGKSQDLYVEDIIDNIVYVAGENVNCFYTVFAERVDVDKLEVEITQ